MIMGDVVLDSLQGKGEHILVVEDDGMVCDMISSMLRILGYSVHAITCGEDAVQYMAENEAHLVILDMCLGCGMNGRETYERILSFRPRQRAIVVSGFADSREIKKTLDLGASGFVKKPYSLQELGSAVKNALPG